MKELQGKKVTEKTKEGSTNALKEGIRKSVPTSLEAISEFKKSGKSHAIGRAVIQTVNKDVADVKSGFGGISNPKAPAPAQKPVELPPVEQAAPVEQINPGAGVLPPVEDQVIDNSKYVKESDDLLKKEEISQENLEMVDQGDLAEANKGRKDLAKDATAQPAAIKQLAASEAKTLNSEMNAEERNSRADMQAKRQNRLNETGTKQDKTKTELEKKREEVAQHINKRYEACQKSITTKLDALEKNSLAQFDAGQERATKEFEDQVNTDINRFKAKRYDRFGGSVLWLKDKLVGIDDFPEVKQAFDRARADFEKKIDTLITNITKANNEVIAACKKELEDTKAEIADYVSKLGPQLLDIGRKAQAEVGKKLDALSSDIESRKEKLQQALADKRKAAMEAIDKKIAAMKEAMSGLLSKLGNLLLEALKKFFRWALEKLGIDAESFMATLAKAGAAIKAIFKSPGKFFSNLIDAIKGSITDFKNNFKTYIISALVDWLTGALGSVGVQIPKEFTVRSVIGMLLQILGLTWAFFRAKLVELIGPEKVAWAEKAVDVVTKFVTGGVDALWDWIKNQAENIKNIFIESTKDWLLMQLVKGFAEWIVSLLIPGGAILRLIQGIYKLVMWFVDNIQRILKWVNAVLNSLGNIAMGAIGAAVGFIVAGIRVIIPAILDFFAKLLNISGIVEAIKKIIKKISDPIHKAIDAVINWVVEKVKKMFGKGDKGKPDGRTEEQKQADLSKAIAEAEALQKAPKTTETKIRKGLLSIKTKYKMASLELKVDSKDSIKEIVHVEGEINPKKNSEKTSIENTEDLPDLTPKELSLAWGTTLLAKLNNLNISPDGKFKAGGGLHAEKKLEIAVTNNWPILRKKGDNNLQVKITRSPCEECQPILSKLKNELSTDEYKLTVDLQMMSDYKGKQKLGDNTKLFEKLREAGISLSVWNVLNELQEYGIDDLTPEQREIITRRVKQTQEIIDKTKK